jgi:hypothetical protein
MLLFIVFILSICLGVKANEDFILPKGFVNLNLEKQVFPDLIGCPFGKYFLVYTISPPSTLVGFNYSYVLYIDELLSLFSPYRMSNLSASDLGDMQSLITGCLIPAYSLMWFNAYAGTLPPFGCSWSLDRDLDVVSGEVMCQNQVAPMIVETAFIPVTVTSTTTTITHYNISTSTTTTTSTSFISTTTENGTKYEFTDTTRTTTVHRFRNKIIDENNSGFIVCPMSINNFFFVFNPTPQPGETEEIVCNSVGMQVANITGPILLNLDPVFTSCSVNFAIFNSYNGYQPACGIANRNTIVMNDAFPELCNFTIPDLQFAFCHIGLPVETTITVQTSMPTSYLPTLVTATRSSSVTVTTTTTETDTSTSTSFTTTKTFTNVHVTTVTRR